MCKSAQAAANRIVTQYTFGREGATGGLTQNGEKVSINYKY